MRNEKLSVQSWHFTNRERGTGEKVGVLLYRWQEAAGSVTGVCNVAAAGLCVLVAAASTTLPLILGPPATQPILLCRGHTHNHTQHPASPWRTHAFVKLCLVNFIEFRSLDIFRGRYIYAALCWGVACIGWWWRGPVSPHWAQTIWSAAHLRPPRLCRPALTCLIQTHSEAIISSHLYKEKIVYSRIIFIIISFYIYTFIVGR